MTLPAVSILVYFGAQFSGGTSFVIGDTTKGVIDNATYTIAGDDGDGVEIATSGYSIGISRGRTREFDDFQVGQCSVNLRNFDRLFDALNSAGIYYGDIVPGKRVVIKAWDQVVFTGTIEDWDMEWPSPKEGTAAFRAEDSLGALGRSEFDAWTTTAGQLAGDRITAILNRPEVAFGANRDIGTGESTLQGDSVTWGSNVLNYAQLVARSDGGRLFASRTDQMVFRDRFSILGSSVVATFRDDGAGGIPFHGVSTQVGSERLYNRVGIDREGGTLQTVTDATSISMYRVRPLSITGLLMDSDIQSASMAEYLTSIYKDPTPLIDSVRINVSGLPSASDRTTVARLDLGDLVRIVWTPLLTGPTVDQTVVVEGIDHDITPDQHWVTLRLGPSTQSGVFILDDPVFGVLDTGPGVLSY